MPCDSCEAYCREIRIESPAVLDRLIERLASDVLNHVLNIQSGGLTWDDVIECELLCAACNQSFRLECETYHGLGGTWTST